MAEIGAESSGARADRGAVRTAEPERDHFNQLALVAYQRALERAPNEETYLLAYGYQALVIGDPAGALEVYRNAARVVPDSIDAFVGMAAANATLHDCAAARAALARAGRPVNLGVYGPLIRLPIERCLQ